MRVATSEAHCCICAVEQRVDAVDLGQDQRLRLGGKSQVKGVLDHLTIRPSIISIAAGSIPAAMTSLTALQASAVLS